MPAWFHCSPLLSSSFPHSSSSSCFSLSASFHSRFEHMLERKDVQQYTRQFSDVSSIIQGIISLAYTYSQSSNSRSSKRRVEEQKRRDVVNTMVFLIVYAHKILMRNKQDAIHLDSVLRALIKHNVIPAALHGEFTRVAISHAFNTTPSFV